MSDLGSRPEWMIFLVLGNSKKSFLIVKAVKFDQSCLKNRPPPIFSQWVKNEMVKIVQKSVAFLALGFSEWDFFNSENSKINFHLTTSYRNCNSDVYNVMTEQWAH